MEITTLAKKGFEYLVCIIGALVSGFVNISVYFNKLLNNFQTTRWIFFQKITILRVIQTEN